MTIVDQLTTDDAVMEAVKSAIIGAIKETNLYEVQHAVQKAVVEQLKADGWLEDLTNEIVSQLKTNREALIKSVVESALSDAADTVGVATGKAFQLMRDKLRKLDSIY